MKLNIQLFAVPARRTSKTSKRTRNSHKALKPVTLTVCPNCNAKIKPHRACPKCGYYKGSKEVHSIKEA